MAKRGGGAPGSARQFFKKAKSVTLLDDTGDDGIATASASSSIPSKPSTFMLAGPKDAETALGWIGTVLAALSATWPSAVDRLLACLGRGIDIVTDYSGVGMPEHFFSMLTKTVQAKFPNSGVNRGCVKFLRASDCNQDCRRVLCNSNPGPQCILGDLTHRAPDQFLQKVKAMWGEMSCEFAKRKQVGEDKRVLVNDLGRQLALAAAEVAKESATAEVFPNDFASNAHLGGINSKDLCFKHDMLCSVFPGVHDRLVNGRICIAIAGMVCKDWSIRGSRMGFLGPSFLPWICWIREMLILLPVIIIAECTTLFDHETFAAAVACHYTLVSLVFSPTDVGMPVERIRKYMVLRRTTVCKSLMDFTPEGFGRVFFRQVKINGDVFYRAPAEMVEQLVAAMAKRMHLPAMPGRPWQWLQVAAQGTKARLEKALEHIQVKSQGRQLEALHLDVAQNIKFTAPTPFIPALLPNSIIYSTQFKRVMLAYEHMEVMGMGVFVDTDDETKCPFKELVMHESVKPKMIAQWAGNSMAASAVGTVTLYALCFSEIATAANQRQAHDSAL